MPRYNLTLNDAEAAYLEQQAASAGTSVQAYVRALVLTSQTHKALTARAIEAARHGVTIEDVRVPGAKIGHDADDYRRAWRKHETVSGVARELGVHRKTAQEMLTLLELR